MLIKKSSVLKLSMVYPKTDFKDNRGRYIQSFSSKDYKKILNHKFVEDDFSLNKKNVFKELLHIQIVHYKKPKDSANYRFLHWIREKSNWF